MVTKENFHRIKKFIPSLFHEFIHPLLFKILITKYESEGIIGLILIALSQFVDKFEFAECDKKKFNSLFYLHLHFLHFISIFIQNFFIIQQSSNPPATN